MEDFLYNKFASPENLRKAFAYIKNEIGHSTLPLDPFWVPGIGAVEKLNGAFFSSLSKLLKTDSYTPDSVYLYKQHKDTFGIRRVSMLTVVDRIVYQAIFNPDILGNDMVAPLTAASKYPRIGSTDDSFLQPYKNGYQEFWKQQEDFHNCGLHHRGEYDGAYYYDSIDHEHLFNLLSKHKIGSKKVIKLLRRLLEKWFPSGRGIPQGPDASSLLGNLYLTPVDDYFNNLTSDEVGYVRYMDDFVLMTSTERLHLKHIEKMTEILDEQSLNLNTKSRHQQIGQEFFTENTYINPYDPGIDRDHDIENKINELVPEVINNINQGISVERTDLSRLKYYLKSDKSYKLLIPIFSIFTKLPSMADAICRYAQPLAGSERIRILILKYFMENHLFHWQQLWLAKLIMIEKIKKNRHFIELDLRKNPYWDVRCIAVFAQTISDPSTLSVTQLRKLLKSAENNFDLGLYLSLSNHLKPKDKAASVLSKYSSHKSLEIQIIVKAQLLPGKEIEKLEKTGDLFHQEQSVSRLPVHRNIIEGKIEEILGFTPFDNKKEWCFFQLENINGNVVVTGSFLKGSSYSAFKSNRASVLSKLMPLMIDLHSESQIDKLIEYSFGDVREKYENKWGENDDLDNLNLSKDKRVLSSLVQELMDLFIEKSGRLINFRRGINKDTFELLPDKKKIKIAELARSLSNAVKN